MTSRPVPPLDACLRPASCWRGWAGVLVALAGLAAAGLAPLKSAAPGAHGGARFKNTREPPRAPAILGFRPTSGPAGAE